LPASFVKQATKLASHKFAEIAFDVKRQIAGVPGRGTNSIADDNVTGSDHQRHFNDPETVGLNVRPLQGRFVFLNYRSVGVAHG